VKLVPDDHLPRWQAPVEAWRASGRNPDMPEHNPFRSTRARPASCRAGWLVLLLALQQPHVGGLGALRPRRQVELDGLALIK
jgi:hypothetical protein